MIVLQKAWFKRVVTCTICLEEMTIEQKLCTKMMHLTDYVPQLLIAVGQRDMHWLQ